VIFSVLLLAKQTARQSAAANIAAATIKQAIAKKTHSLGTNI
jgi:hypothetical protein